MTFPKPAWACLAQGFLQGSWKFLSKIHPYLYGAWKLCFLVPWTFSATWMHLPNGLSNHPAFELLDKPADLDLTAASQLLGQLHSVWLWLAWPSLMLQLTGTKL